MKKLLLFTAASVLACSVMAQQEPQKAIYYSISFPNAAHHEAEISMTIPQAPSGAFRVRMSRSSAGRYATHEFGKNIYNVKATDVDGKELPLTQIEGDVYEVGEHPAAVKVSYTLFGNWTDGTYASIDPSHAHLNMPATFMWVVGQDKRPLTFEFNDIDKYGWKVASQLKHEGSNVYSAPNLQYMMDSPTELSNYNVSSWEVVNTDGKKEKINLTMHSDDGQGVIDNFGKMIQKLVLEEKAVFGELPTYDFGEYTFVSDVNPAVSGDGMEHRNSTSITIPAPKVEGFENNLMGVYAHEYFHSWNVKRIRPKSLEPFNFEHANMSSELWFAEGFTQYYGELLLARAGFVTVDDYTKTIAGLVNQILNTPAAAKYSAAQMSRYSVFADAGVSIDPNNNVNDFTSYYTYGGAIALALDLRLRSDFNMTLDDYMRAVWLSRGKVMKPYTIPDLQTDLGKVTNNPKFAADFFKRYINGTDKNNYEELLAKAGLVLRKVQPGKGWAGPLAVTPGRGRAGQVRAADAEGLPILSSTTIGTPVYKAGLDAGDVILKVDGKDVKDQKGFSDIIADKKPGDKIMVNYKNRTGAHETTITLEENPNFEVVTFEKAGKQLSKEQETFRNNWLQSKVK
ncbi:M61 family metallopeptidase [Mucilaginibacter rubeus]|uniref:M61 family metallopeptidase n=1 Tax=Mucilaginibacter rubeus TaxID=2027860 RepID=A0AAE6JJ23_9SPHI|nr:MULTISPECIES: PDZ domain-containing protein [Mucilaginibacter]QEM06361.1 M61 family metallopeptidase [Mucilaginibacter rubeus]QEM18944.1 M61 family metallopeptidase [Mucilaginibacter gossypii]QTE44514.1 M61 family metallopeptidase [Mucilaginibacter rubeus]QTE51112.1 M61 family metallopeptidase [Mucilaginibacter rubeus]QTE56198.1 M61 family metallopeptidase [Mucilaginibacter rubeus]